MGQSRSLEGSTTPSGNLIAVRNGLATPRTTGSQAGTTGVSSGGDVTATRQYSSPGVSVTDATSTTVPRGAIAEGTRFLREQNMGRRGVLPGADARR